MALPLLAVGRAAWEFFAERVVFEPWSGGGMIPVEVEPVEPRTGQAKGSSRGEPDACGRRATGVP